MLSRAKGVPGCRDACNVFSTAPFSNPNDRFGNQSCDRIITPRTRSASLFLGTPPSGHRAVTSSAAHRGELRRRILRILGQRPLASLARACTPHGTIRSVAGDGAAAGPEVPSCHVTIIAGGHSSCLHRVLYSRRCGIASGHVDGAHAMFKVPRQLAHHSSPFYTSFHCSSLAVAPRDPAG
jgi:hypothetical protein